jgi:uncharacterized protein
MAGQQALRRPREGFEREILQTHPSAMNHTQTVANQHWLMRICRSSTAIMIHAYREAFEQLSSATPGILQVARQIFE